ncbi:ankyrin repeats (3 copies) domain-containing protein [Pochonia chlamydosporia 170]|uniref:Ankyrin repeats (3 copies) domain-containing protein n=1 Tax=Pochonia chlamydosporia 170 TaxID=1380566 RepID=A0A179F8D3_METCM|nr:ankyrin repeats (3 copies) domain-containing protein [Pochonia chlamydosporia 170]OAQ61600.1 ankyrin repeats (3 copies) domain-containing protein [Pochonia chlamydosporia 170]
MIHSLPQELILSIADFLDSQSDINALGQTCRHLHRILDFELYLHDAKHSGGSALFWASIRNQEQTVKKALQVWGMREENCITARESAYSILEHRVLQALTYMGWTFMVSPGHPILTRSPLFWAADHEHVAIVRMLLESGEFDVHQRDPQGNSLLHIAAGWGKDAIVKLLLDMDELDADVKDEGGHTPLYCAVAADSPSTMKLLLQTGKFDAGETDAKGRTLLSIAAGTGKVAALRYLMGLWEGDIDKADVYGRTTLSYAAGSGHESIEKMLLDSGRVDANSTDKAGWTPLSHATTWWDGAIVKTLLESGKINAEMNMGVLHFLTRLALAGRLQYGR